MPETKPSCACCATQNTADSTKAAGVTSATQEAKITVKGGYSPATVNLERGVPARLVFDRQESSRCSEELVIAAFGVRETLPQGVETVIELTPTESGVYTFACGMGMLRGQLVVS